MAKETFEVKVGLSEMLYSFEKISDKTTFDKKYPKISARNFS